MIWTGLFVAFLLAGCHLGPGRELHPLRTRLVWMMVVLGLAVSLALNNPFLAVLCALLFLNVHRHDRPSSLVPSHLYPALGAAGAYVVLTQHLTSEVVVWALGVMVGHGVILGLWAAYSYVHTTPFGQERAIGGKPAYLHRVTILGITFCLYEQNSIECGQANPNHLNCLAALNCAAVAGLAWMGYAWVWLAFPFTLLPIVVVSLAPWGRILSDTPTLAQVESLKSVRVPTMGVAHLLVLLLACLPLLDGVRGFILAFLFGLVAVAVLSQHDHSRWPVWRVMLDYYWWRQSWSVKLLGCGTDAWTSLHKYHVDHLQHGFIFAQAHNEFVQQWVEHGLIGMLAMVGYCGTALWLAVQAGPSGQAVYLLGAVMVSCGFLHFPWTWWHQIQLESVEQQKLEQRLKQVPLSVQEKATILERLRGLPPNTCEHGSPTLLAYTFVLVVLLEVVR